MSGFFEYEMSHNPFLLKVQDNPTFRDLFKHYCLNNEGVLLVPQTVALEKLNINQTFLETHIIVQNPSNRAQFVTLNGAKGVFSGNRESFYMIANPPVDNSLFNPLADPQTIFADSIFSTFNIINATPITVLREGHSTIKLDGKDTMIPLILISDPLMYEGVQPITKVQTKSEASGSNLYGLPIPSLPISMSSISSLTSSIPNYIPSYLSSSPVNRSELSTKPMPPQNQPLSSSQKGGSFWNTMFGSNTAPTDKPPLFPDSPVPSPITSPSVLPLNPTTATVPPLATPLTPSPAPSRAPPAHAQVANTQQSNMTSSRSFDSLVTLAPPPPSSTTSSTSSATPSAPASTVTPSTTPSSSDPSASQDLEAQKRAQFLQKLKHPRAANLMKLLKNFIVQFRASSPAEVEDQGQVVRLLLTDLEHDIEEHPLWQEGPPITEEDLDIIREALEKHVTTKLYHCTFPPARTAWNTIKNTPAGRSAIDPSTITLTEIPSEKDVELTKLISSLQFITPKHLDIHPNLASDAKLNLARAELRKINNYKTPRDKMVCILNCCKVIFNLLNNFNASVKAGEAKSLRGAGADEFLPLLIYVTLKANPPMLDSNAQYIQHFRHPSKLIGESGYYFTNLLSVISFFQILTPERLSIDPEEFERLKAEYAEKEEAAQEPSAPRTAPTARTDRRLSTSTTALNSNKNSSTNLMDDPIPPASAQAPVRRGSAAFAGSAEGIGSQVNSGTSTPYFSLNGSVPVDTDELIRELAGQFTFMKYTSDELKISQIPILLDDYKRLALENLQLKKALASSSAPLPPSSITPTTLTPTLSATSLPPPTLTPTPLTPTLPYSPSSPLVTSQAPALTITPSIPTAEPSLG